MKKRRALAIFTLVLSLFFVVFSFSGCDLISEVFDGDTDTIHKKSFEPITGKFILALSEDETRNISEAYFVIDGGAGNFSLKYYEDGALKREGKMQRVVTHADRIGKWTDNLHFNVKVGDEYDHICSYTENLTQIDQFRVFCEYHKDDQKYYLSELPYALGTYVREGKTLAEESPNTNDVDYTVPTLDDFTAALDGYYKLDEEHYFYFVSPRAFTVSGSFYDSYFAYYSPDLSAPLEGFVSGRTLEISGTHLAFKYVRDLVDWLKGDEGRLVFGYTTFDEGDNMIEHPGTVDFRDGRLNSFSFEHISRRWTEEEWDVYTRDKDATMPDAIIYEYAGGTYSKTE